MCLGLHNADYLQILTCVSFWLHSFCGKWEGWDTVNWFKYTSWVAVVTPAERVQALRNCCEIEVLVAFCIVMLRLRFFYGYRGFCQRTESIRSFPFSREYMIVFKARNWQSLFLKELVTCNSILSKSKKSWHEENEKRKKYRIATWIEFLSHQCSKATHKISHGKIYLVHLMNKL